MAETRHFSEDEVREAVWEDEVYRENGDNRRWSRSIFSVVKVDDKFYELNWEEGLTESQENYYHSQDAPEVEQVEETTTVIKWIRK